jgi:uncharacterized protein
VTNVTAFGAFVDIGVHQDGLVHVSELVDRFVRNPHDVVKVNQKVSVTVMGVDIDRKRISLSMRENPLEPREENREKKTAGMKPQRKRPEKPKPSGNPFANALKDWKPKKTRGKQ